MLTIIIICILALCAFFVYRYANKGAIAVRTQALDKRSIFIRLYYVTQVGKARVGRLILRSMNLPIVCWLCSVGGIFVFKLRSHLCEQGERLIKDNTLVELNAEQVKLLKDASVFANVLVLNKTSCFGENPHVVLNATAHKLLLKGENVLCPLSNIAARLRLH